MNIEAEADGAVPEAETDDAAETGSEMKEGIPTDEEFSSTSDDKPEYQSEGFEQSDE